MKTRILFLLLSLILAGQSFSQNIAFEQVKGPYGGGSRVFSGKAGALFQSFGNVIYRSSDDGLTWQVIPPPPANVAYYYLGSGADGNLYCAESSKVYRSTNNGDSWLVLPTSPGTSIDAVAALPSGEILVAHSNTISRSTDDGQTWATVLTASDAAEFLEVNPVTGDIFGWSEYIPNGAMGKLRRSSDKGLTWTTIFEHKKCVEIRMAFAPNGTLFAGGEDILWKSTDNGQAWAEVNVSPPNFTGEIQVGVSQTGRVFAFQWYKTLFSDDNGTTWQEFNTGFENGISEFVTAPNGKLFGLRKYASTYSSTDNGENWAFASQGIPFAKVNKIHHIDDANLLALTDDGVWQSTNGGTDWTLARVLGSDGYGSIGIATTDADTWFVYDGIDQFVKLTNSGATKTLLATPSSSFILTRIFASKKSGRIILSGWDGIFTSDDEGQTWVQKGPGITPDAMVVLPDASILVGDGNGLFRSTDDGDNWTLISDRYFDNLTLGENESVYHTSYDYFVASPDGGLTWDSVGIDPNQFAVFDNLTANNVGHLFSVDGWGTSVLRSIDGGLTFNQVGQSLSVLGPDSKTTFSPNQTLFITTDYAGILRSKLPTSQAKILTGTAYFDKNKNCGRDLPTDTTLIRRLVKATKNGESVFGYVNNLGKYRLPVEPGDWAVEAIAPNGYWAACTEAVNIPNTPAIGIVDSVALGLKAVVDCPLMTIEIGSPFLRRCFESTIYAKFENAGTAPAIGAELSITLDPWLVFNSASIPVFSQNGQVLQFMLGDLQPGASGSLTLKVTPSCTAPIGQLHCVSAHVSPDVLCPPTFGAQVTTSATCAGGALQFFVSNIGQAAMAAPLDYYLTAQNWNDPASWQESESGQFQLAAGETKPINITADGSKTYQLWAQQSPDFPFNVASHTLAEGCGTASALVPTIANDDEEGPFDDQFCIENIGSFDPNDKQGFPVGLGMEGFIEREQPLEYLIRFQNTGTDTAFNITVRDTLPVLLDPATIRLGLSSHPCRLTMMPDGSAMFLFEHILLPDSNVNEATSHGFVQFSIAQKPGNPLGTEIKNRAGIYFDFNEPVLTNFTRHTVGIPIISGTGGDPFFEKNRVTVSPNPMRFSTEILLDGIPADGNFLFEMHDLTGRMVKSQQFNGPRAVILRGDLPGGLYQFWVKTRDGEPVGKGTISVL